MNVSIYVNPRLIKLAMVAFMVFAIIPVAVVFAESNSAGRESDLERSARMELKSLWFTKCHLFYQKIVQFH